MKLPDLDRLKSEKSLSFSDFLKAYNDGLPLGFPRASAVLLKAFKKENAGLFKGGSAWSLDHHRKKVMDWLVTRARTAS